ncbi:N-acetyltransferase [Paractinoplanes rishiriensis]|uniref:N-acetyltransferase n=1 Tax=Paractinoplanes rishiriensis TaxID=1050105 RepID=A0A919MSK7_9ACTN|nr:N-acetyltransferase [Actinoplanes rishiriensis]
MTLSIRPAEPTERDIVADLWNAAAAWLHEQGQDQWQYPIRLHAIEAAIADRTCWLVWRAPGDPVATVTLDDFADPRLWLPEDQPGAGRYVHRLVVTRTGGPIPDLGSAILDWASIRAANVGATWLRLDAWTNNTRLHKYYLERGFHLVRSVYGPDISSGVLFERRAGAILGVGPRVVEDGSDGTARS